MLWSPIHPYLSPPTSPPLVIPTQRNRPISRRIFTRLSRSLHFARTPCAADRVIIFNDITLVITHSAHTEANDDFRHHQQTNRRSDDVGGFGGRRFG